MRGRDGQGVRGGGGKGSGRFEACELKGAAWL